MLSVNSLNMFLWAGYCDDLVKTPPVPVSPEMEHFLFKGHKVCFTKTGTGDPMVFFHNAGNDHRIWDAQVAHFSESYEVYAIDSLGYGQSDRPDIDYTLPLYSEMVGAFMNETGIESPIIVGHCIGAAMALDYSVRNPKKVKALILFNIATLDGLRQGVYGIYYRMTRSRRFNRWVSKILDYFILPRWKARQEINMQYGETGDFHPQFTDHLMTLYKHPRQLKTLANLAMNFDSFAPLDHFSNSDDFPPVFLIWGEQNSVLPVKSGDDFYDMSLPDRYEIIEKCGHLVMREKPDIVNTRLDQFFQMDTEQID